MSSITKKDFFKNSQKSFSNKVLLVKRIVDFFNR